METDGYIQTTQATIRLDKACPECEQNLKASFTYWKNPEKRSCGGNVRQSCGCENKLWGGAGTTFEGYEL